MKKLAIIAAASSFALALSACDAEQTEEGSLPDVDVEGGQLPEYDVDAADVNVTTEERTVEVPVVETEEADASAEAETEAQ